MSVELLHIEKSFGQQRVLHDVNFTFEKGRVYCLMGPSGSGKTTLLRVLLGLERADGGSVRGLVAGDVSVVFQEDRLCNVLTPVENLALVIPGRASRRRLRDMLSEILPERCLDKSVIQLSGGQRRRVSLVRAMAFPSKMVVMDEPFTGLDTATRRTTIEFILRYIDGARFSFPPMGRKMQSFWACRECYWLS